MGKRILLLEDETPLAQSLMELLASEGFDVRRVVNGAEGLRALLASEYDVIICDMVMPGLPGDLFYLAVQRTRPHLCERFLFTTGHRADSKIDAFLRQVRGLMLWKPFQPHELLDAVKAVLGRTRVSLATN